MEKNSYFGIAQEDFKYAEATLEVADKIGNYNYCAMLCAQSAEKFMKAVAERILTDDDESLAVLKTHNLRKLVSYVKKYIPDAEISGRDCKWLGDFYFDTRYPGDNFTEVLKEDAEEALAILNEIREECFRLIERMEQNKDCASLKALRAFDTGRKGI